MEVSTPQHGRPLDVAMVSMPFGPLHVPSMGLSLLKPSLKGLRCQVFYFGFAFADRIGPALYETIALREVPVQNLLGDWIFQPGLFDVSPDSVDAYLDNVIRRGTPHALISGPVLDSVLRAREGACDFLDWCADRVLESAPRIVGFTSVFQQHMASLALARRLKQRNPAIFVLFGGANCEGVMGLETMRQFPFLDAAVSGEADLVFPELVQAVIRGQPIDRLPGVYTRAAATSGQSSIRTSSVEKLDELPYPDFDDFFDQFQASSAASLVTPRLQFETSRGCWWGQLHHCTFCGLNGATMAYRSKSARRAMDELAFLAGRYPGRAVMVADNILDLSYFKDFIPQLASRKLKLRLFYEVKANLRKDQVRQLRDAGIAQIQPGIESFSDTVLNLMRKGIRGLQNIQLLKWCKELGIWPIWNLIWGFPGEPPEEYRRMTRLIPLLTHLVPPGAALPVRMDRFSPNFERSEELGFANVRPAPAYSHVYPLESSALRNLAYYFDYDYQQPRDVDSYTSDLLSQIAYWRDVHRQSELIYVDNDDELCIWDLRPAADRFLTTLTGLERSIYLACDGVRSLNWLHQYAGVTAGKPLTLDQVEQTLHRLVGQGLMIRDRDSYLSLAIGKNTAHPGLGDETIPATIGSQPAQLNILQ